MAARVKLAANKKEQERHDNLAGCVSKGECIEWASLSGHFDCYLQDLLFVD